MITLRTLQQIRLRSLKDVRIGTLGYLVIFAWSLIVVMVAPTNSLPLLALVCLLVAALVHPRSFRAVMHPRLLMLMIIMAIPPVFLLGDIDRNLAGIAYSSEGLQSGIQILIRIVVVLIAISGLTSSVDISSIAGLLERFGMRGLGFSVGVAFNLLPFLQQSAFNAWRSLWMRGGFRKQRLRALRLLLITIISGALERAGEIALAAESRAYTPERSRALPIRKGAMDWPITIGALVSLLGIALI
jgi:energy-coupling factor transporter transmembrane protein EcfT